MYRKLTAFLAMAVIAVSAFASASPKQVEDALAANNFTEAKQMIAGVLAEHPSSARGHLLNAYVLAKADHNKQAANDELRMVEALDKKGDVKNSPLFGRTVAAVEALPAQHVQAPVPAPVVVVPAPHYQTPAPVDSGGHGFLWFLIVVVFIAMIVMLIVRSLSKPTVVVQTPSSGGSYGSTGYGGTYTRSTPSYSGGGYAPASAPVYTSGGGSSALGTGMAVAGGVVAGSLIADSLLHHHDRDYSSGNGGNWGGNNNGGSNGNYGTGGGVYPASTTESTEGESTEVRRDSFNSGSSSSTDWEPAPAPAPSRYSSSRNDDSSSSSSSSSWGDSSSSSSSSDSSSSWGDSSSSSSDSSSGGGDW